MTEDEYGLRDLYLSGRAVDIGGYLGTVAIALLLDNPNLTVECVEPIPENADLIARNAEANGVAHRLRLLRAAAGDGSPVTVRYAFGDNENDLHHAFVGNSTITGSPTGVHKSVTVPSLTPADFPGVDFIKIDCEGGEWPFFAAGSVDAALIVGEWHPVGGHTSDDLFALLPGYDITFSGPEAGPGEFRATRR
jgi:FkbM family methyltransferase